MEEVIEQEVAAFGEEPAALEQGRDFALMAIDQPLVRILFVTGPAVLHAVLLSESLNLAVTEHGQSGQSGHHDGDAEALVPGAELVDRGALVGIAHEIDVALHDVGIELEGVLDDRAVLGVLLVAHHVHEGAVVDAMHAEGANEVALHEPEGLSKEQRAGNFGGNPIDNLAPELVGHAAVEVRLAHAIFGARGDGAARARAGKPEAMKVALGQRHGGIKTNDGKEARYMEDGLDDLLAYGGIEVIELGRVVPWEAGAVVSVVDVAGFTGGTVSASKDHGGVGLREVVILDFDLSPAVVGEIGAFKTVGRVRQVLAGDEPVRVLDHPG